MTPTTHPAGPATARVWIDCTDPFLSGSRTVIQRVIRNLVSHGQRCDAARRAPSALRVPAAGPFPTALDQPTNVGWPDVFPGRLSPAHPGHHAPPAR